VDSRNSFYVHYGRIKLDRDALEEEFRMVGVSSARSSARRPALLTLLPFPAGPAQPSGERAQALPCSSSFSRGAYLSAFSFVRRRPRSSKSLSLQTDEASDLRSQLSESRRELSATKLDYLQLEDRHSALEDEKAALAEQIKSAETELAAQKVEGKALTAFKSDLALATGKVSMTLHKLQTSETRLREKEHAYEELRVRSSPLLGFKKSSGSEMISPTCLLTFSPVALPGFCSSHPRTHHRFRPRSLLLHHMVLGAHRRASAATARRDQPRKVQLVLAVRLRPAVAFGEGAGHSARQVTMSLSFTLTSAFELSANLFSNPPADAAALNSINLDDIVNRAELLDELGGTTLAKTLVTL
jgi:multidrug efflux pump subunit AcrA (membrane-fusion protein)